MTSGITPEANAKLLEGLAQGKSVAQAATAAGVSERTVYRRLSSPKFRGRIMQLRAQAVAGAGAALGADMKDAANVLAGLLTDADPRIRQRAAVKVIELALKCNAVVELERRLDQVERYLRLHVCLAAKTEV